MNRRGLLKAAGAAGITVTFMSGCSLIPPIPKRPVSSDAEAIGWVRLTPDGVVEFTCPRVEFGQNILTACLQIVAEETGLDPARILAAKHSSTSIAPVRATVGSDSIKDFALPLARAAALLREAILARAAAVLSVNSAQLVIEANAVVSGGPRPLSLAEVAKATHGAPLVLDAGSAPQIALRTFGAGPKRYVGHAERLADGLAIVSGQPLYAADIRLPGMRYGAILRAPVHVSLEAKIVHLDEAAAARVPGFVRLVRAKALKREIVGVVAETPWALPRILAALAPKWSQSAAFDARSVAAAVDVDAALKQGALRHVLVDTKPDTAQPWTIDLRFEVPLAAHAPIEPRAAVAHLRLDGVMELWVGSQDVFYVRDVIARELGLNNAKVLVHGMRVGGAFGGKTICTVELEAALLARAAGGPVKLQWSRAEEFQQGFHRPPSTHRIRARVDGDGRLTDWHHALLSSHILFTNAVVPAWLQKITDFRGDDGVARGALSPYFNTQAATRKRIESDARRLPVYTGPWRGLGAGPNIFASESAIDAAARAAGRDPVAFRLANLPPEHARLTRCLEKVQAMTAAAPKPAAVGAKAGRGFACGIYKEMSYCAVAADVMVGGDGAVRVTHLWCAHDCGLVINPDQVRAQIEGNLVWGIGMALKEELTIGESQTAQTSFASYALPRMGDVPAMQIELIIDPAEKPTGAGETAIVAAAAAIANAVADATGTRPARLPIRLAA